MATAQAIPAIPEVSRDWYVGLVGYGEVGRILAEDLRAQGFKLRDCASFGLPGRVRMAVVAPEVQDALVSALLTKAKEPA